MNDTTIPKVVIQVTATAVAEMAERFEVALQDVVAAARASEGCLRYEWFKVPENPRQFFIYGEFESEAAFDRYREGPVVKAIGETLLPLVTARPTFVHHRAVVMAQG